MNTPAIYCIVSLDKPDHILSFPFQGLQEGEEEAGERGQVVPSPADVPAVREDPLQQAVPRQPP